MEELDVIIARLNVPSEQLTSQMIQDILIKAKKQKYGHADQVEKWTIIIESLWVHLQAGLNELDDQLLCATCFYSALPLTEKLLYYLNEVSLIIQEELKLKRDGNKCKNNAFVVSLMYGMFQSAFLLQGDIEDNIYESKILTYTIELLIFMAYEYSRYTYIVFKTINWLKKLSGNLQGYIQIYSQKLFNLVNHNWENPITGVRDLNRGIFKMLISVVDTTYDIITKEINTFYWNKAKYLMLSEIIVKKHDIKTMIKQTDYVEGLLYSLQRTGLVSAGTDMYYTLLNKLHDEEEWCDIFLQRILKLLVHPSRKAAENFSNYWTLTTFKRFPSLANTILDGLQTFDDSDSKLYSCLHVMKQANKLGLIKKDLSSNEFPDIMVSVGIEHWDPYTRMSAFSIICASRTKQMPTQKEYELILCYLQYNVNSDCTLQRLNMLHSIKGFLIQIQSSFLNIQKSRQNNNNGELFDFCKSLQLFTIQTLNMDGNYQRKITSVKIFNLILDCFNSLPNNIDERANTDGNITIAEMLITKDGWILYNDDVIMKLLSLLKDSSDDVRESVANLLLKHFSQQLRSKTLMDHLIEEAFESMRSKFFYQTGCGRNIFKLITTLFLEEPMNTDTTFKNVEDVFMFGYNELSTEFKNKTDVVKSIETGKQLHSLISILHVVLEVCYQNAYKIKILDNYISEIVIMLEEISNQFAWKDVTNKSSDFAKINDMVQDMIATSGLEQGDETQLSGLQQIVLSCLWLNVKASCELSVLLIKCSEDPKTIGRCLSITTGVLETCRHKGAMEAAGTALGAATQYLTLSPLSLPAAAEALRLALARLAAAAGDASVTRRGAGRPLLLHRIAAGDRGRGKPLFHYLMDTLLEMCNIEDTPEHIDESAENQKDLPKAVYIHFLTKIVMDRSLLSDVMCYSAVLGELAFGNLTSPHWQIRNAALQLYGALLPKLIGQKKASGCDDEAVACDEFRTHSPKLWLHITHNLKNVDTTDQVQGHSNLVPILNILANCARRYNFSFDMAEQQSVNKLLASLMILLGSPLYTVRRLTAKCIYNMFSFDMIFNSIMKCDETSENYIHGCLTLLTNCYKRLSNKYRNNFNILEEKFDKILNNGTHSYLCRQLYEEMFSVNSLNVKETLLEVQQNVHAPGVFLWAEKRIEKCIRTAEWGKIPEILCVLLEHDYELYCAFILRKIKRDHCAPEYILSEITELLLVFSEKYKSSVIWEILFEISLQINLNVDITDDLQYMNNTGFSYKLRYAIPFAARVAQTNTEKLAEVIYSLSDPETADVNMRHIAALANNELGNKLNILPNSAKLNAIKATVILLQDEDEDVRNVSARFYTNVTKTSSILHPNICLSKILDKTFLDSTFCDSESIAILCEELYGLFNNKKSEVDQYNPFSNYSKNIYMEADVVRQLIKKLM